MAQGDKSAYTDKQKRQAEHIEEGLEKRGTPEDEAERIAWATVNKQDGGGKKSGSGRAQAPRASKNSSSASSSGNSNRSRAGNTSSKTRSGKAPIAKGGGKSPRKGGGKTEASKGARKSNANSKNSNGGS